MKRILRFTCLLFLSVLSPSGLAGVHANAYTAVLFDGTGATAEVRLLALTLAGTVNRDSARLYLQNVYETWSYPQTDERWATLYQIRGGVQFETVTSDTVLVNRFRSFLAGGIRYDAARVWGNFPGQSFRWQGEYAALIGGLTNRLPVTAAGAMKYRLAVADSVLVEDAFDADPSVWVPGVLDAPVLSWNNAALSEENRYLTMLRWGVRTLLPRCHPAKMYIREITDFTVQQRMFQLNLAGTNDLKMDSLPAPRWDLIDSSVSYLRRISPSSLLHIYGWIRPEPMTQWFARRGASFHETLLGNLSWHASFPVTGPPAVRRSAIDPDTVHVRDKYYLLFLSSEGDASNWVFGFQGGAWFSLARGTVPVGWGWNLHLLQLAPFVARYYQETATDKDGFISVTTPLGFSYPDFWPADVKQRSINDSRALMEQFQVRDVYGYKHYEGTGSKVYRGETVTDDFDLSRYAEFQQAIQARTTFFFNSQPSAQAPTRYGNAVLINHKGDGSFYGSVTNLSAAAARIIQSVKGLSRPGFLLAGYQRLVADDVSAGMRDVADLSLVDLRSLVQLIKADPVVGGDVEVVTPEFFSALVRKQLGVTDVPDHASMPSTLELFQNYPNPFNPTTTIDFQLPIAGRVSVRVIDLLGREVAVLVNEERAAGRYSVGWRANNLPSGMYLCQLRVGEHVLSRKMILLR